MKFAILANPAGQWQPEIHLAQAPRAGLQYMPAWLFQPAWESEVLMLTQQATHLLSCLSRPFTSILSRVNVNIKSKYKNVFIYFVY